MSVAKQYFCPLFRALNASDSDVNLYQEVIVNIRVAVSGFSFLGSLFVIGLIWLFKKYKFFVQRLILYLSVSAFLSSIAYIMGRVDYDPTTAAVMRFCEFQGFWLLLTDWMVAMSIFCVTFNLLWSVFTERSSSRIEYIYMGLIFFLPSVISCIPFIFRAFGPSGAWCWIKLLKDDCTSFKTGKFLQFAIWYVPQTTIIALLFVMYIAIVIKLKSKIKSWQGTYDPNVEQKKTLIKGDIKPLIWYPSVYLVVCVFPFINRIYFSATDKPLFVLYILHVLSSPLQGALTALVYALDRETLKRLNWQEIKASWQYRKTDAVVHEYPVGPSESDSENQPFIINANTKDKTSDSGSSSNSMN